jgi:hypothetical protein
MTTLARNQPPPPDDWKVTARGAPLCQVCEKPLTVKWLKDPQLGPCCMDVTPPLYFVISARQAALLLRQNQFVMQKKPPTISLKTHG